ncbi:MAG: DegT/DnrJ/EryC1/StrS family aminotransferase [Cytophagaceae bacterium]|nr:DegT/DnrJ/EryC1/StrS family aminotransferase [Cytophagaceae bacterium]
MVDLEGQFLKIEKEVMDGIRSVISSSTFIQGPAVKAFEKNLAAHLNVAHCIACANGTDALQIAMMALDLKPGDEIIVPSFTYIASVEAAVLLGIKTVFVEVNESTFNIDETQIEKAITPKTKAILVVHLYGQSAPMESILATAKKHALFVIEDNAQAINATYTFSNGTTAKTGCMGDIGTTSFFPSKNLGCYGDGGALLTNHVVLAEKIKMIANHGQKEKYHHDLIGVNSRLDSLQAAVLNIKLKQLDTYTNTRQEAALLYDSLLKTVKEIEIPVRAPYSTHVFHQYTLKVSNRSGLQAYLKEKGIPTMVYYPLPTHLQKGYQNLGYRKGDLPVSESLCEKVLSLPIHSESKREEITYICEAIINFYQHG